MVPLRQQCCALYCTNKGVLPFPKNEVTRRLWEVAVNYIHWKATDDSMLCPNHFKPSDFHNEEYIAQNNGLKLTRKILKKEAIPSLFLQYNENSTTLQKQIDKFLQEAPKTTQGCNTVLLVKHNVQGQVTKNTDAETCLTLDMEVEEAPSDSDAMEYHGARHPESTEESVSEENKIPEIEYLDMNSFGNKLLEDQSSTKQPAKLNDTIMSANLSSTTPILTQSNTRVPVEMTQKSISEPVTPNRPLHTNISQVSNGNMSRQNQVTQQNSNFQVNTFMTSKRKMEMLAELREVKGQLLCSARKEKRRKERIKTLKKLMTHPKYLKFIEFLAPVPKMLTNILFREATKRGPGRRFTEEEKELARNLYSKSPRVYKCLLKIGYILPFPKILKKLDLKHQVDSAVNRDEAIKKLKEKIKNMKPAHRLCTLLFDEKLLRPENRKHKIITTLGAEGDGNEVTFEADHTLLFMVKSILIHYQEPVSYTFSYGPTSETDLAMHIRNIITDLQTIGFKILATICNHSDNNRRAIKILINEARCDALLSGRRYDDNVFLVNDQPIIALYDLPHLLKGMRNHLISKDLTFVMNGKRKTAKWHHLEIMLSENLKIKGEKLVPKLTEKHVYPTQDVLSETKFASQIFSQTVSSYMGYLAEKEILPTESQETADLLLFFDQLFDSLNGFLANTNRFGKPLLRSCKLNSPHHKKWEESIEILQSMRFIDNGVPVDVVDIGCWIWTLQSMQLLMKKVLNDYKMPNVWMRHLNQDTLEKLFHCEVNPPQKSVTKKDISDNDSGGEVVTQKVINAIARINESTTCEANLNNFVVGYEQSGKSDMPEL